MLSTSGGDVHAAAAPEQGGGETVVFPLSFPQQRLWLLDQVEPGSPAYNLPSTLRVRGALDPATLERVLAEIVSRHESLRTRFGLVDGEPSQLVDPPGRFVLPVADLAALPPAARKAAADRIAAAEGRALFDLGRGPLFRARLLRLAPEEHLLLLTTHHIVSDGWSSGVLLRELALLYGAFTAGEPSPLPELPIQYGDYAVWQREELAGEALDEQVAFWRAELEGAPPATELPLDRPHPPARGGRAGKLALAVSPETALRLAALARAEGATPFMVLLAASAAWLGRYADADDVVLGTPIAGRTQEELEGLIGFFVNTLAIRVELSGDPGFARLVARVRARLLGAYAHQDLPFEKVVEELRVPRDPGRTPVFQVMFVHQAAPETRAEAPGADGPAWATEPAGTGTAKFDLVVSFVEHARGIAAVLDYDADLFDEPTVERMGRHLLALLDAVAADPHSPLSALPLLPPDEERRLLAEWSAAREEPPYSPVHRRVVERALREPHTPAALFPDAELGRGELERRSAAVARRLRAEGVGPETRVALLAGRSPEMLVGVLGILRAGGAYVPLDPAAPAERLAFVLRDSGARVLVAEPGLLDRAAGFDGVVLPLGGEAPPVDDGPDADAEVPADALAYVIYTSGSTGTPKGVMVSHRALASLVQAVVEMHGFGPDTRVFSTLPVSFDASIGDIFPALLCGGALVLHPAPGELSAAEMLAFVRRHRADAAGIPVALWSHWLEQLEAAWDGGPLPLPAVTRAGGESMPLERARAWRRLGGGRARVVNYYGPTETTVIVTAHEAAADQADTVSGSVPIGRPLPGTGAYVLDRRLRPVPAGGAGELWVGGVQVARGYLGRPALTAARFLPDPYSGRPGARMYGTGDRVRRLADGALEFLGRIDDQVKVRGFRVEPGEVEAALLAHPEVREAAVVAGRGPGGETRLAGYFVASGGFDAAALREHLRDRLPEYMVPAALVRLDALPLTSNGKTDRRALPPAEPDAADYVAPRDAVEEALAAAWAEALGVERVGVRDDFFELGGHSLSAARLVARIRERLGREVSLADLFRGATVERLARSLQGGAGPELPPSLVRLREGRETPFFCVHAAGGMAAAYLRLARGLDDRPFYGLQARGLAPGESPDAGVEEMAARYLEAIRAVQPRGPYLLGGWSVGGTVAWEVARRLSDAGEEVALLALIDSWAPVGEARPLADDADLFALLAADLGASTEPATLTLLRDELRALRSDARLPRFREWLRALDAGLPEVGADELGRRLDVYRATARAAAYYHARPGAVPVTLFRATRSAAWPSGDLSPEAWERDPRLRWRELTAGEPDVRQVAGTHHSIVVGDDVDGLAAALRSVLAAVAPT
ncbi:MAG TPA: amino acid adenylation domain-containing protein [Longimicrobiaceae bacterium]|jgi:amino acid adenylation domain-containing protein